MTDLTFFTNEPNRTLVDRFNKNLSTNTKSLAMFHLTVGFSKKSKNVDIFNNIILMRGD